MKNIKICKRCNQYEPMNNEQFELLIKKNLRRCKCGTITTIR